MDNDYSKIHKIWHQTFGKLSHDIANKLATIRGKSHFLGKIVPQLQQGYDLAAQNQSIEPSIKADEADYLKEAINLEEQVKPVFDLLDAMYTFSASLAAYEKVSATSCIQKALDSYPFENNIKNAVIFTPEYDFELPVSSLFIDAIITHFLYASFHNTTMEARKKITITLSKEGSMNRICCKLDSTNIKASDFNYLTEQYITTYFGKTLPGIQFCKLPFFNIQGHLDITIQKDQSLEMMMSFPLV